MSANTIKQIYVFVVTLWVVLVAFLFGCGGKELSDREIEVITKQEVIAKQIAEAEMKLKPFLPNKIWQAYQPLQKVLSEGDLETSNPKLAAKAHRLMAGVYFAAFMIVGPPMPGLPEHEVVIHNAVKSLGQGGWEKAKKHIEESLRLDSKQPDASKLREAAMVFEACVIAGKMSLDQFSKLGDLLIPAVSNSKAKKGN